MAWLKFYRDERNRHPAEFNITCPDPHQTIARLVKLTGLGREIKTTTKRKGSRWSIARWEYLLIKGKTGAITPFTFNYRIEFIEDVTWGEVVHEFAHILDASQGRWSSRHDATLAALIDSLLNRINKEQWIENEIETFKAA